MLKNDIKINTDVIRHLLLNNGALSVRQISEFTNYKEIMVILSLGWLASEDKINFIEKGDNIYVELKHPFQERYY